MQQQQILNLQGIPQQIFQGGQLIQNPNGMFQMIQPIQAVNIDGQEALFMPNIQNAQLAGAQVNKTIEINVHISSQMRLQRAL